mmetsp:Transcript_21340/g.62156  ORF Transcript_21340/g.62156 Transcript_21340/m.62156 type:complete len:395 (-) Transcript_21340:2855-4039(-)
MRGDDDTTEARTRTMQTQTTSTTSTRKKRQGRGGMPRTGCSSPSGDGRRVAPGRVSGVALAANRPFWVRVAWRRTECRRLKTLKGRPSLPFRRSSEMHRRRKRRGVGEGVLPSKTPRSESTIRRRRGTRRRGGSVSSCVPVPFYGEACPLFPGVDRRWHFPEADDGAPRRPTRCTRPSPHPPESRGRARGVTSCGCASSSRVAAVAVAVAAASAANRLDPDLVGPDPVARANGGASGAPSRASATPTPSGRRRANSAGVGERPDDWRQGCRRRKPPTFAGGVWTLAGHSRPLGQCSCRCSTRSAALLPVRTGATRSTRRGWRRRTRPVPTKARRRWRRAASCAGDAVIGTETGATRRRTVVGAGWLATPSWRGNLSHCRGRRRPKTQRGAGEGP